MVVDFRCENCGKLLSLDAEPGSEITCPHCQKLVAVPAGLAGLPRPQVPPDARPKAPTPPAAPTPTVAAAADAPASAPPPAPADQAGGEDQPPEEEEEEQGEGQVFVTAMAKAMPFVISIFFHLGLMLVFALITLAVAQNEMGKEDLPFPSPVLDKPPGGMMTAREMTQDSRNRSQVQATSRSRVESEIQMKGNPTPVVIAAAGGGGASGSAALAGGGSSGGPSAGFFGQMGGNIHHVVYVIDRSGSMVGFPLDTVRNEMIESLMRLDKIQDFHVVFFNDGPNPVENPPKRLVPATEDNKMAVAKFLTEEVSAFGATDPVPALKRAFVVLKDTNNLPGKMIFLLTDGEFKDNEAVLSAIKSMNPRKDVLINTFLFNVKNKEAESVMRTIAKDNGGFFKNIIMD